LNPCPDCRKKLTRVARGPFQRMAYRRIYACPCGRSRIAEPRPLYSLVARCPKCSRTVLRRRHERDRIDPILRNPFRLLQMLLGGNLYHCQSCRLQFHDLRSRSGDQESDSDVEVESESTRSTR